MLKFNKLVVLDCRLSISGSAESPQLPQYKTKGNRDNLLRVIHVSIGDIHVEV